jgi:hypothetical protein
VNFGVTCSHEIEIENCKSKDSLLLADFVERKRWKDPVYRQSESIFVLGFAEFLC